MSGLFVRREGHGPFVVLVHGGVRVGELTWSRQLPLAERWTLLIVERAGYGRSNEISLGEDIEVDAPLVADLLNDGAHLVGHSSGAVVAMLAAARRPEAVLSLTLCEPPAFQVAAELPEAAAMMQCLGAHVRAPGEDAEWLRRFVRLVGGEILIPDQLPQVLADGIRAVRNIRRLPWEVDLPLGELAATPFPKLVVSGDHSRAFEVVCDNLAAILRAERGHARGAGHMTPDTGTPFNDRLEAFLASAAAGA